MGSSKWDQYQIESLLVAILAAVDSRPAGHHLGPPYLTAYQLAIELQRCHPDVARALGYPLGGEGIGQPNSLAQYLGQQLSRRIHTGEITGIEGALFSDLHVAEVVFKYDGAKIKSTSAGYGFDHTMFRISKK